MACTGFCNPEIASTAQLGQTPPTQPKELVRQKAIVYGYDTVQGGVVALSKGAILEIAQQNPMVAGILVAFLPENRNPAVNLVSGVAYSAGKPTLATVLLQLESIALPKEEYDKTLEAVTAPADSVGTRWTSRRIKDGLEITFHTELFDANGVALGSAYPPIVLDLKNSVPATMLRWRVLQ